MWQMYYGRYDHSEVDGTRNGLKKLPALGMQTSDLSSLDGKAELSSLDSLIPISQGLALKCRGCYKVTSDHRVMLPKGAWTG